MKSHIILLVYFALFFSQVQSINDVTKSDYINCYTTKCKTCNGDNYCDTAEKDI